MFITKQVFLLTAFEIVIFIILYFLFRKKIKEIHFVFYMIILLLIPFCFLFGVFWGGISKNICYSNVISDLKLSSSIAVNSSSQKIRSEYLHQLDSVVVNGYESQCEDLEKRSSSLYHSLSLANKQAE
ncbi:hypothetical protein ACI2I2_00565 [Scandinavium sp. NPDC088450]|uniref:hypothetical protein n=1 Tax=Scandinavium sp. NPDC088450 TaxID=3364514 RepID=UPI003850F1FA